MGLFWRGRTVSLCAVETGDVLGWVCMDVASLGIRGTKGEQG